jgi:DNA gyrase subunit A
MDEMKDAYMDYAMSVIVSRALPDVRDGLKPVHRRILYTMREENITPDRPHKKSAATVGNVLARYHPHGDASVYDAMVRMAQDFSMRYPLVQGHGNFGSVDGDRAAAMRYTESRLARIAMESLNDLDKDTVDWRPNFDSSTEEPTVLPAKVPNLLLNGSDGIAVGMATKIPPHNLRELIDGLIALLDNPELTVDELMEIIPGPDFPTGATILGQGGIREAYSTGRGSIIMRAVIEVEERPRDRKALIVTEIPYQVNKSRLLEKIADSIKEKRIEGISDLRDESDRKGMRIVMELTQGTMPDVVTNQLYKHSELQTTFGANMVALVNNVPKLLDLRSILLEFIAHRREVITRRTRFLLDKAERRAHILEGLLKALDHIDEIIKTIRASADATTAREALMRQFEFSEPQAQAILDMRLQRLTGLERDKLEEEFKELQATMEYLRGLLNDPTKLDSLVVEELTDMRERFGDDRRSEILPFSGDFNIEDLIAEEQMVVTISHGGYIKRVSYATYRSQKRGGRGVSGTALKEEDHLEHIFVTSTHHFLLFFTNKARVFKIKVHQIGEYSRTARGEALINLFSLEDKEKVQAIIPVRSFEDGGYVSTCTREGIVKRSELSAYAHISARGLIALTLKENDELVNVRMSPGGKEEELILISKQGMAIRFSEENVRQMGRTAAGVKGIKLREGDEVVAMDSLSEGTQVLVVTENGYGKRTPIDQYPSQTRGGLGVKSLQLTEKTGPVVGARMVTDEHELMVSTRGGTLIRMAMTDISVIGRATQGVRLIRLDEGDAVTAIARVLPDEEAADGEDEGEDSAVVGDGDGGPASDDVKDDEADE